ncbi:MAG: nuclear transport factor 2 family protein [Pseudomonadota bacterium]
MKQEHVSHSDQISRLLTRFSEAWVARDLERVQACFHRDAVYFASVGPLPGQKAQGHSEIRDLVRRMFAHDATTSQTVSEPIIAGDAAFQTWTYRDADGRETPGCDLFRFRDGLIVLKDAYRKTHTPQPKELKS